MNSSSCSNAKQEEHMTTAAPLGTLHEIALPQGTIRYSDQGTGPTLVFIAGLLANSSVWGSLIPRLTGQFRCIAPDLPLGSHSIPMHANTDLTPLGVAHLIADFLTALDLHDITLIGSDTGGALCQIVIAHHPERITRLVLANCDAFEEFFPPKVAPFHYGALLFGRGFANFLAWVSRSPGFRRRSISTVSHRGLNENELSATYQPLIQSRGIRRDLTNFLRAVDKRYTLEAAKTFPSFHHPVLLVWGKDDIFFSVQLATRLQQAFPDATLKLVSNSRAFVQVDQPDLFAEYITEFVLAAIAP
jgi:pimeloyl-ACP methyl ester carboxylesterase